ncbi:inversin-A isoform X2 [Drosophila santomea]|uniref:inversin-A isoform X2 n=1 Tax=Drosophila santomea TaxID=129105 RepID=UPI0019538000|nr:inversin-A isoform X2 [Drosophila santomea]
MFTAPLEFDIVLRAKNASDNLPELLRQRDRSHRNALHYCAVQDSERSKDLVAAASIAIAAPELLESADEDGFTPLHLAVIQGNLAMVNLLLANKAEVNAVDNEGHSVVHWATVCGEVESLRAVLAAGASVAKPDANGGTPLHYAAQMCGASHDSKQQASSSTSSRLSLEILGILLSHPQSSVDVQDKDGRQPLLWAASAGSAKAVIALVKAGARVESSDKDGLTALHCAGSRGHTECIDTLIGLCGAPTDLIDSNGCTALHYAVTLGHADATARLLDLEADPNRQDRKGRTPAHCGCSKGQFETLKLLKERGANLWLRNAKGDLPLHEAAASGRRELLEWLLNQRPKQVNTTSNDGRSLLHIAAANDYTDMCKLLLDYGADVNAVYRNSRGLVLTPLDGALQRGHRSTAKFLQANGGQPANKVRLSSRRTGNPFHETNATDMVRPLRYVEKEELHDLRSSKKYVVYLKRSDSDNGNGNGKEDERDGDCSCSEQTYRKEQRLRHVCRRHKRRQLRRRTSSCGESKHERCSEICRSKSNIEIRRRKSRERYASSSEWEEESAEDSCENCCYHKRQKDRVVSRKRSTSSRKSKNRDNSDRDEENHAAHSSPEKGSRKPLTVNGDNQTGNGKDQTSSKERPPSASRHQTPPTKEGTFIKSPTQSAQSEKSGQMDNLLVEESHAVELTDEEQEAAKSVVTQVDVHHDAEEIQTSKSSEEAPTAEENGKEEHSEQEVKLQLSEEETQLVSKEVEQVIKIAATALSSESKSSSEEKYVEKDLPKEQPEEEVKEHQKPATPSAPAPPPATSPPEPKEEAAKPPPSAAEQPQPNANTADGMESAAVEPVSVGKKPDQMEQAAAKPKPNTNPSPTPPPTAAPPAPPTAEPKKPPAAPQPRPSTAQTPTPPQPEPPQREQETRRSFTLLPSDSADDDPVLNPNSNPAASASDEPAGERKSSFQVLKSDDSLDESTKRTGRKVDYEAGNQVFKVVGDGASAVQLPSAAELEKMDYEYEEYEDEYDDDERDGIDPEHDSALRRFLSSGNRHGVGAGAGAGGANMADDACEGNGRKRRLKKRVRSGNKTRSNWKNSQDSRDGSNMALATTKDQDSGFEPSPRAERSKIPTLRSAHTAHMPRRPIYATLDGRSCSSRMENRKPGDKGACDMGAVTRSIQRNIRRYYMERKIFQHLLELKSLQIRSSKLNEAVLVKRAVDDYHKSCVLLGGETGTRLRRYNFSEYTFKNFELFLYETLKGLQRPGTNNFQNINEVYEEAERRLSPDYNAYEKALQCTTKTHRCLHAAHAYTGIPCAAYIPMMNHHTMPKFGFGPYKKTGSVSSFFLPKILTSGRASSGRMGGMGSASGGRCNHKVALELSHGKNKQLISLPAEKLDSNKRYYVTFTVKDSSGPSAYQQQQQHQQHQQQCGNSAGGK